MKSITQKMKQLREYLSKTNTWFQFNLSIFGALGVGGLVLALFRDNKQKLGLPWFKKHRNNRSEKLYLVPGLKNLGNNCFLNVVLQALASCLHFEPFLRKVIHERESSGDEEWIEGLQLSVALATLLEELSASVEERVVLNPRKVMIAMSQYIPNFNLTSQQDAEEAFLHLLSSLREESSDCFSLNQATSLADALDSSNLRILFTERRGIEKEQERWQRQLLGPFDGILSSSLTCQSCSSQISMNFQFFHSLPISIPLGFGTTITPGCTLEDCMKQFVATEQVENYKCSHCWHGAAIKYLSLLEANDADIEKLKRCNELDSCNCQSLTQLGSLPWSNKFSHTLKRLRIARCPKILCIHLQRASTNHFGELIKLQGHIRFQLVLDLYPFMLEELQHKKLGFSRNNSAIKSNTGMAGFTGEREITCNGSEKEEFVCDEKTKIFTEPKLARNKECSDTLCEISSCEANGEIDATSDISWPKTQTTYRLVSVVEHFGKPGGGHYTVHRSIRSEPSLLTPQTKWFCISDSDVYSVSQEKVLAAEASLLFYEKIETNSKLQSSFYKYNHN